jgi:HAD superfamily hydrolase (TIGR01549 family)
MKRAPRFSLITFDLDDTLWDARPVLERAEQAVTAWFTRHCPRVLPELERAPMLERRKALLQERPDLHHRIGALRQEAMRRALLNSGESETSAERLAVEAFAVFIAARHAVEPFTDVDEILSRLKTQYTLAALTNGNADIFRMDLGQHFAFAYRAEDLMASKPDAAPFEAALKRTGIDVTQMVHIGDHPEHDVEGAQRLGITPRSGSIRPRGPGRVRSHRMPSSGGLRSCRR